MPWCPIHLPTSVVPALVRHDSDHTWTMPGLEKSSTAKHSHARTHPHTVSAHSGGGVTGGGVTSLNVRTTLTAAVLKDTPSQHLRHLARKYPQAFNSSCPLNALSPPRSRALLSPNSFPYLGTSKYLELHAPRNSNPLPYSLPPSTSSIFLLRCKENGKKPDLPYFRPELKGQTTPYRTHKITPTITR